MENVRKKNSRLRMLTRALETTVDITALAFALRLLVDVSRSREPEFQNVLEVIALIAGSCFLGAVNTGKTNKLEFAKYIINGILFTVGSVLMLTFQEYGFAMTMVFVIYMFSLMIANIFSIIKKPRAANIVIQAIFITLWTLLVYCVICSAEEGGQLWAMSFGIMIPVQMLIRVTRLSFAHIRFDILAKVIRRSMAVEILSGLMILVVSFSFALSMIEPSMETYSDALWYCFAIVTTIGFGDVTAITPLGRVLSVILGLYGIIVVSLITSVIVNFYSEMNRNGKTDIGADNKNLPVSVESDDTEKKAE
ncbi:MAG: two pore domain potassium channel family protein [Ruminiclostridium sp.]|nr:two pore domain potassium channel family protein [Ruminiclostridium sp.]